MKHLWIIGAVLALAACGTTAEYRAMVNRCAVELAPQYPTHTALKIASASADEYVGRVECRTVLEAHLIYEPYFFPPPFLGPPFFGPPRHFLFPETRIVHLPRQICENVPNRFFYPRQDFAVIDLHQAARAKHIEECTLQNCQKTYGNKNCRP